MNTTQTLSAPLLPRLLLATLLSFGGVLVHAAEPTFPERPGQYDFLRDEVELFTQAQVELLRYRCHTLLTDTAVPVVVVTLPSVERYAGEDVTLEEYARSLFNHWGIGRQLRNGKPWNRGILVLYVQDTGKVRVELGGGWGRERNAEVRQILFKRLVPLRENGDPAGGLLATVEGLAAMVRTSQKGESSWPLLGLFVGGGLGGLFLWFLWQVVPWGGLADPDACRRSGRLYLGDWGDGGGDGSWDWGSFDGGSSDGGGATA